MMTRVLGLGIVLTCLGTVGAQERIPVQCADDLPRFTYTITGTGSDVLMSDEQFTALAAQVRRDIVQELEAYDIQDLSTLRNRLGLLIHLDLLAGDHDAAMDHVARRRDTETKEAARLTSGLETEALVMALRGGGGDEARRREIYRTELLKRLRALPWDVIDEEIRERKGYVEYLSANMLRTYIANHVDPTVSAQGGISGHNAHQIVTAKCMLEVLEPFRETQIDVYATLIRENRSEKQNIWPTVDFSLVEKSEGTPVCVAIWDTGVDTDLFENQLFVNPDEQLDGVDNDRNGFVDDLHGIAFDGESQPSGGLLAPLDDLHGDYHELAAYSKGLDDLKAAIDSDEAAQVRRLYETLTGEDYRYFMEDMELIGIYEHGTGVAAIAAAGNPYVRLLPIRITFHHQFPPPRPTLARARAEAEAHRLLGAYCREHGVRVVNMSWVETRRMTEDLLETWSPEGSAEERAALSRRIFEIVRESVIEVIRGAPEILFVAAAGNFDTDVEFEESFPCGLDLPNLLVVGAVDQAGQPTGFTSFGGTVDVYANGLDVASVIPGGRTTTMSGTSVSAPAGANLAAKILAVKPELTPTEVIEVIRKGAKRMACEQGELLLLNPLESMAQALGQ